LRVHLENKEGFLTADKDTCETCIDIYRFRHILAADLREWI